MPADRRENDAGVLAGIGITNVVAEKVWRALMRHPEDDLSVLATHTGVTPAEISRAIQTLVAANLVTASSKPSGVSAIDPRLSIETHIARAERQLAERNAELTDLRTRIAELVEDYAHGKASAANAPGVEIVVGLDDVRRRIYLASDTVSEVQRSLFRSPSAEGLRDANRADRDQQARGVDQRTIIGTSDLADRGVFDHLQAQHDRGERVRALGNVPTQMLIMDESLAILAVDPAEPRKGAIFVREPGLLQLLIYLFDHLWAEADPVFNVSPDPSAPSGRPARILELVAGGVKDEKIARTLGVATRTVRRDIAELRNQLGVTTRTEIVAAAVRRGWL